MSKLWNFSHRVKAWSIYIRVAWFTPFAEDSSIGRFSLDVTPLLSRWADVDIWHARCPQPHRTHLRTVEMPAELRIDSDTLASYDITIYNVDVRSEVNAHICLASQAVPGITILHGVNVGTARDFSPIKSLIRNAYAILVFSDALSQTVRKCSGGVIRTFSSPRRRSGERVYHLQYARDIWHLALELLDAKPMLLTVDQLGRHMADLTITPDMPIVERVSQEALRLFCPPDGMAHKNTKKA